MLVPGGFGKRGIEGKIEAIRFARENGVPFFGICLGLQCATIEFARNVRRPGRGQQHRVQPKDTPHPVVCLLDEQTDDHADRRHDAARGVTRASSSPGRKAHAAFRRRRDLSERHRHRYEFNNDYRERFDAAGMVISGTSPDGTLVEIIELPNHPWFVAVQFHPEFKSKPTQAHPLFRDFIGASLREPSCEEGR